jgi:hypothetical protein
VESATYGGGDCDIFITVSVDAPHESMRSSTKTLKDSVVLFL